MARQANHMLPWKTDAEKLAEVTREWDAESAARAAALEDWISEVSGQDAVPIPEGMSEKDFRRLLADAAEEYRLRTEVDPIARWRMHPKQRLIAEARQPFRMVSGGNGTGKTKSLVYNAACTLLGCHPFLENSPRARVWICGEDYVNQIQPILLPQFFGCPDSIIPDRLIDHWDELERSLFLKNGSVAVFKSYDSGRRKFQSDSIDEADCDEMAPDDIFTEIVVRLRKPPNLSKGRIFVAATPLLVPRYYHKWVERAAQNHPDYFFIKMSMWDNCVENGGFLSRETIEMMIEALREDDDSDQSEVAVRVYGEPVTTKDAVYPRWPNLNNEEIPKSWPLYDVIDPSGSGPTGWLCAGVQPNGDLWVIDEYKERGLDLTTHARNIKMKRAYWEGMGYVFAATLIDPAANQKDAGQQVDPQTKLWMNVRMQYMREGLPTRLAHNKLQDGIERVKALIAMGKLHIHRRCVKLCRERMRYCYKAESDRGGRTVIGRNDHLLDCLRYLAVGPLSPDLRAGVRPPRVLCNPGMEDMSIEEHMNAVRSRQFQEGRRLLA